MIMNFGRWRFEHKKKSCFFLFFKYIKYGLVRKCDNILFPLFFKGDIYKLAHLFLSGSVYRDEFDLAILKLQEDNRLEILKRKWWDGGKCPKEEDHRAKGFTFSVVVLDLHVHLSVSSRLFLHPAISPGLGMENIGGIFVVLVCGLLVAIFMAVLEFVWMLKQVPGNEVRGDYLTCVCFVSFSPLWHPSLREAVRFYQNAHLWQEAEQSFFPSEIDILDDRCMIHAHDQHKTKHLPLFFYLAQIRCKFILNVHP